MCRRKLKMPDHGAEPFVRLPTEHEPEIRRCRDVIQLVGDLAFVDVGHELEGHNGVLGWISLEVWKLHDLRLHSDVGVGLNLPCQVCSIIVALNMWLNILNVLLVETGTSSDWVDVGHDVCLKRSSWKSI